MISGLDFVLLHVTNIADVLPFYTEKLGFEIESQQPDFVQFKQIGGKEATFALFQESPAEPSTNVELWWHVDDAATTLAELQTRSVTVLEPLTEKPFGLTFALQDPLGHPLHFLQPR